MKVELGKIRAALPFLLAGSLALAGCDNNTPSHETRLPAKRHSRTVDFRSRLPIVSLSVTEACDDGTLLKSTDWIVKHALKHGSNYENHVVLEASTHSTYCDGDLLTTQALEGTPRPYYGGTEHHSSSPVSTGDTLSS